MGKSFLTSSLSVEDDLVFAVFVFSDEMLLDIKEGLLLCLPEVDREPPRAKEERHVVCVFARVAAKVAMIIRKKVTSTASK